MKPYRSPVHVHSSMRNVNEKNLVIYNVKNKKLQYLCAQNQN